MSPTIPKTGQLLSQTPYTLSPATNGTGYSSLGYNNQTVTVTGGGTGYNFAGHLGSNTSGNIFKVSSDAEFNGKVKLQGRDLIELLDKIEQRLAILHHNPDLESRWDELKELAIRYKELEAEIIEKEQIWATLKK